MGACLSIGVKAQTPIHLGIEENESSDISTKLVTKDEILKSSNLKIFCFDDLKAATRNFRPDSVVGEDRFGQVFKGSIDEQTFTIVKPEERFQGQSEWLAEIEIIGLLDHPCLVKVIGYCLQDELRLLVYEFMANGSLEDHLFRSEFFPLSWNNRMRIALDAANGLSFIHSDEVKLIYGVLKTSDILLDSKLSPFCARARIIRTNVYEAPEHDETGTWTDKSDIYSFGVIFLEILTGRRALDLKRRQGEHNLVDWAVPLINGKQKLLTIMDPRNQGQYSINKAQKAANLAMMCLSFNPKLRPNMPQVVTVLEQLQGSIDCP